MRKFIVLAALLAAIPVAAQQPPPNPPQQDQKPPVLEKPSMAPADDKELPPPKKPITKPKPVDPEGGKVVEEIIARVNNEIITRSELDKARSAAEEDARQECQGRCTPEQLQTDIDDRRKNALRDLIDQSLLVQRGKDMDVNVEPEVIKRLDQIRIQNKLEDMDALEKAVTSQGLNWEDFKDGIRKQLLTQRVVSSEVGSHISIGTEEVQKYYDAHKTEFVRPEQVALRSIEINTQGKKPEEITELRKKADTALKRVQDGEDFGEIAKRFSDGSTAKEGGYLGTYKRGELSKELEDRVFAMKRNDLTPVIETKQGFLILQVLEHYSEGQQTVDKVKDEIMDKLYNERLEPAMREYLKTLREQSYVTIKPGYQDIAGGGNSEIQEVSATPEATKNKKGRKKFLLFGKRPGDTDAKTNGAATGKSGN
ncbi:MAG TPA: peptidylprolyl isomerase [Candidatus Acidoferrales bacterium]|nr:peptidylprolyl isomerase [Candidatus Acidoferrales bacterium]